VKFGPGDHPATDCFFFEKEVYRRGFQRVAGIDEVGRGPLAGPVVAAAVILPPHVNLPGVKDSKQLRPAQRERLYDEIHAHAFDLSIGCVDAGEIDKINILQATFKAMIQAVGGLRTAPDYLLIDGPYTLPIPTLQQGIPKGDQLSISIAAASIIAKVYRDRLMHEYHRQFPVYAFDRNKGYGSLAHREALRVHGPCAIHRLTFRGVTSNDGKDAGQIGNEA
jgi:ribonuclease HII